MLSLSLTTRLCFESCMYFEMQLVIIAQKRSCSCQDADFLFESRGLQFLSSCLFDCKSECYIKWDFVRRFSEKARVNLAWIGLSYIRISNSWFFFLRTNLWDFRQHRTYILLPRWSCRCFIRFWIFLRRYNSDADDVFIIYIYIVSGNNFSCWRANCRAL